MMKMSMRSATLLAMSAPLGFCLSSCEVFHDHVTVEPGRAYIYEVAVSPAGLAAEPRLLGKLDARVGAESLRLLPPRAYAVDAEASVFDLGYSLLPAFAEQASEAQGPFFFLQRNAAAGPASRLALLDGDLPLLDAKDSSRILVRRGSLGDPGAFLFRCDFGTLPSLGTALTTEGDLTVARRSPLGLWPLAGSGHLALAWDWDSGATVAAFLDENLAFVPGKAFTLDWRRLEPLLGFAADGRILLLAKESEIAYRALVFSSAGLAAPAVGIVLPAELAGAKPLWAGDRFWFRSGGTLASLGFDLALGSPITLGEALPGEPLTAALGLEDGGLAFFGPVYPLGRDYRGPIAQDDEIGVLRYPASLAAAQTTTIRIAAPEDERFFIGQVFVLAACEGPGGLTLLASSSSTGIIAIGGVVGP